MCQKMFQITYLKALACIIALQCHATESAVVSTVLSPQPNGLQSLQLAGKSLTDTYDILISLASKQSPTCDVVKEIYKIWDFEAETNRNFFQNTRSKDETLEYLGLAVQRLIVDLAYIDSQFEHDSCIQSSAHTIVEIPQELKEFIQLYCENGNTLLRLSGKQPIDVILNALSDILEKSLRAVSSGRNASASSIGRYLAESKIAAEQMRKLEQEIDNKH